MKNVTTINNGWTDERRAKQSALIHTWKPWKHSTGARTRQGKDKSKMNARRITPGGLYRRMCKICYFRKQVFEQGYLSDQLKIEWNLFSAENDDWLNNATEKRGVSKLVKT
jgi:hypothetical protein